MNRREFLESVLNRAGVLGLLSVGLSLPQARAFAGTYYRPMRNKASASSTPDLTFVGGASDHAASGTAVTITHGISIQSGDLVLAWVHANTAVTITDNNGGNAFTEADEDYLQSNERAVYWRVAAGSETSYAWTLSGSERWGVIVAVFRPQSGYAVQSPPFDVAPATVSTGTSTAIQAAAQTGTQNNVTWVATAYVDGAETFTAFPSGYTQAAHLELDQPISVYYKLNQNSGSTGTADWTLNSSQAWGGEIIVLKPGA